MLIRALNKAEEAIISLLLVAMTLLVFLEVVLRFVFSTGFIWSQELTLHISAWFVLFGASYGLKVGAHIGVDAFVKLLPHTLHRIASGVAVIGALTYCGLFCYGSWVYLSKMKKIGIELEDLPIATWIAHSILIFGLALIVMRLVELLWSIVKGESDGFRHVDEAKESMHLAEELSAEAEAEKDNSKEEPKS